MQSNAFERLNSHFYCICLEGIVGCDSTYFYSDTQTTAKSSFASLHRLAMMVTAGLDDCVGRAGTALSCMIRLFVISYYLIFVDDLNATCNYNQKCMYFWLHYYYWSKKPATVSFFAAGVFPKVISYVMAGPFNLVCHHFVQANLANLSCFWKSDYFDLLVIHWNFLDHCHWYCWIDLDSFY